jgi:NAD(P)-dependent dehydrogenase (short-subunit alcohol dehydrogenase family)
MFSFEGKSVLVAGGTSGIGKAIANAFDAAGATVTAAGLGEGTQLDVTDNEAVKALVESHRSLDILVNAAGVIRRDAEFEIDTFSEVIDINLTGAMRACVAAREHLKRSKGCIVNIASMLTFFGGARVPAYSASKGGIAQLTRSLAVAWAQDGIRVNAVAPGWIATPLTQALQDDPIRSAPLLSRTPMGRWGEPDEVAGPVMFLCSDAARFVTGAILTVDGGYSAA